VPKQTTFLRRKTMANKPVHEIRLGTIKASLWTNETEHGTRYNVTVSRLYRADNQWKTTESFGRDDLPLVCKVMNLAHTWIFEQGEKA
jgi:hypothetical protein